MWLTVNAMFRHERPYTMTQTVTSVLQYILYCICKTKTVSNIISTGYVVSNIISTGYVVSNIISTGYVVSNIISAGSVVSNIISTSFI